MSKENPSEELESAVIAATAAAVTSSLAWDYVEAVSEPVYDYITILLNKSGAGTFLVDWHGDELTVGVAVRDENNDDILASEQFDLSDMICKAAAGDECEFPRIIAAIERSLGIAKAKMTGGTKG